MKTLRIEQFKAAFADAGRVELDVLALVFPEGPTLHDGNHRCCALYLLDLQPWEVRLRRVTPSVGSLDALPNLS